MSDRTVATLIVHDVPADQVRAVLAVIRNYDLTDAGSPDDDRITLDDAWEAHEIRVGASEEIAARLCQTAPGAIWTLWEDPAYEWLGDVRKHVPTLGIWGAACDADGTPVFTEDTIRAAIRDRKLAEMFGDAWTAAIAAVSDRRGATVVATPGLVGNS